MSVVQCSRTFATARDARFGQPAFGLLLRGGGAEDAQASSSAKIGRGEDSPPPSSLSSAKKEPCNEENQDAAVKEATAAADQDGAVETTPAKGDDKNPKQEATSDEEEEESNNIPSLDAFVNYDEEADALSSMAPILETTTTHVLDMLATTHDKQAAADKVSKSQVQDGNIVTDGKEEAEEKEEKTEIDEEPSSDATAETDDLVLDDIPEDLTLDEAQEVSSSKRLEGKQLHDDAEFKEAARAFSYAALLLEPFVDESAECAEDWSTCRLHEALCCLKDDDPETAVAACTRVLDRPSTSGAVRARALYRRAKAYTGLEEHGLALQDARSAAFLGDRRGVALYGQLMRESPAASSSSSLSSASPFLSSGGSPMDDLASSSALFESLLSKSSGAGAQGTDPPDMPPFNPLSLLSGMSGSGGLGAPGKDGGGLAKSVLSSLSKKLEDEATQDTICKYLKMASGPQIQQYAGMAGMELPASQATRIADFLRGVTPKSIRRTVKNGKRLVYGVQLIRKTSKVITKYRNILIWIGLLAWAKSALLRPLPVNKRAARLAAKQAAKQAAKVV